MAKIVSLILVLMTAASTASAQCTTLRANNYYKRSIYEFSVNLIKRLCEAQEGHFVSSPYSAWSLISSISFAAEGETLDEIRQVLRLHHHTCFTKKYFETIINVFQSDSYSTTLEKSSAIFIDESVSVKESFVEELTTIGIPGIERRQFDNPEEVAGSINEYVSSGTAGKITEIVTVEDIQSAYVVFIDAIYFKAPWHIKFLESETETSAFYDDSGVTQIGDVSLMYVVDHFNVTHVRPIRARVLELPYGDNGRFSMLIFLPDRGVTLMNLIDSMKRITLRSVFALFELQGADQTNVQIPRFKISSDLANLKELLSDMGLASIFDRDRARFPGISSEFDLYLSNTVQKATIEVNEEGSEATAASSAAFESKSLPQDFVANKPFLFMIVDKPTEVPIFVGGYAKPSVM